VKVYCVQCGSAVAWTKKGDAWRPGRCPRHPWAKRMSGDFIAKRFAEIRAAAMSVQSHEGRAVAR